MTKLNPGDTVRDTVTGSTGVVSRARYDLIYVKFDAIETTYSGHQAQAFLERVKRGTHLEPAAPKSEMLMPPAEPLPVSLPISHYEAVIRADAKKMYGDASGVSHTGSLINALITAVAELQHALAQKK